MIKIVILAFDSFAVLGRRYGKKRIQCTVGTVRYGTDFLHWIERTFPVVSGDVIFLAGNRQPGTVYKDSFEDGGDFVSQPVCRKCL